MTEEVSLPAWALTLWQPYAALVARGDKPLENRPPGFLHQSFRGEFWIHAGAHLNERDWEEAVRFARKNGVTVPPLYKHANYAFSAIIGRATIAGVLPVPKPGELPDGWRMAGRFAFVVQDAVMIARPVECPGKQGFWRVAPEVLEKLRS